MKRFLIAILVVAAIGVAVFLFFAMAQSEPVVEIPKPYPQYSVLGHSVQGRSIDAYTYQSANAGSASGRGTKHLLFVGGIHGGYEWNSVLLAYEAMDYFTAHPDIIPANVTVTVIPSLNPDGVFTIIGKEGRFAVTDVPTGDASAGRFNAHAVDLNRNFDCKWSPNAVWKGKAVSAGTAAFSEPEAVAMRDFVSKNHVAGAVFWHSKANAVYASECTTGILPTTLDIMNAYSKAAGYAAVKSFDAYPVTGDVEGWLASVGVPAISVELATHETVEWEKNLSGIKALLAYYATK